MAARALSLANQRRDAPQSGRPSIYGPVLSFLFLRNKGGEKRATYCGPHRGATLPLAVGERYTASPVRPAPAATLTGEPVVCAYPTCPASTGCARSPSSPCSSTTPGCL